MRAYSHIGQAEVASRLKNDLMTCVDLMKEGEGQAPGGAMGFAAGLMMKVRPPELHNQ